MQTKKHILFHGEAKKQTKTYEKRILCKPNLMSTVARYFSNLVLLILIPAKNRTAFLNHKTSDLFSFLAKLTTSFVQMRIGMFYDFTTLDFSTVTFFLMGFSMLIINLTFFFNYGVSQKSVAIEL